MRNQWLEGRLGRAALVALTGLLLAFPVLAQDDGEDQDASSTSKWKKHLSIHGYLTAGVGQLYLDPDTPRGEDEKALGLSEDAAFHGVGALNFRLDLPRNHAFVLQLSSTELGDSPTDNLHEAIELDWLFYEYRPSDSTRIRVGRFPAAAGIYSEIRDAGVLLPFFRPAFSFYREGALLAEAIDGVGVTHTFFSGGDWSLTADAHYGEFTAVLQAVEGLGAEFVEAEATSALGGQLWLATPVEGLEFRVGGMGWDVTSPSAQGPEVTRPWKSWFGSVDWTQERWSLRGEFRRVDVPIQLLPGAPLGNLLAELYYLQLGWQITPRWGVYLQPEFVDFSIEHPFLVGGATSREDRRDTGISLVYRMRTNMVFKGEYHAVDAEKQVGANLFPGPGGFLIDPVYQTRSHDYAMASVSLSF